MVRDKGKTIVLATTLVVIGFLLLAKGIEIFDHAQDLVTRSIRIPGTVVTFVERPFLPSIVSQVTISYPVVQFVDPEGTTRKIESHFGIRWKLYDRGEPLEVLFNPQHPNSSVIHSFGDLWLQPCTLLIIGIPLLFVGITLLSRSTKP